MTPRNANASTHVALLRGINVGGKNLLPMKALVALFEDAGCRDVRTYIQSGNVVFQVAQTRAARLPKIIERAIEGGFGFRAPVVIRSLAELRRVLRGNPFLEAGFDTSALHVAFLADAPGRVEVAALDPQRSPGDAFAVRGSEIFLHCSNGIARTKLTNVYFDAKLGTISTMRNWKTVLQLLALAEG